MFHVVIIVDTNGHVNPYLRDYDLLVVFDAQLLQWLVVVPRHLLALDHEHQILLADADVRCQQVTQVGQHDLSLNNELQQRNAQSTTQRRSGNCASTEIDNKKATHLEFPDRPWVGEHVEAP